MADINQSVALGLKAPDDNGLLKAASTYATMAQATAHAGLYSLEAQKQQMFISAANKYSQTGDPNAFSEIGHPEVAKGIIDSQKEKADFQNKQDATYSYYASQLPKGQLRDQFVNGYLSTAIKNNWMTPVEATQRGQFYAQDPDKALQAGMSKYPEAVAAASQNAALIARSTGEAWGKVAPEIATSGARIALEKQGEAGQLGQPGAPEAAGAAGASAARGFISGQQGTSSQPSTAPQSYWGKGPGPGGIGPMMSRMEETMGLPKDYLPTTAIAESGGDPKQFKSKNSSATGPFQIIDETGKDLHITDRNDWGESSAGIAKMSADNMRQMQSRLKRDPTGAELYLSHIVGSGTSAASMIQNPDAPISSVMTRKQIAANGINPDTPAGVVAQKYMGRFNDAADRLAKGNYYKPPGAAPTPTSQATGTTQPASEPATAPQPATSIGVDPGTRQFLTTINTDTAKSFEKDTVQYRANGDLLRTMSSVDHDIETLGPGFMGTAADKRQAGLKAWNSFMGLFDGGEKFMKSPDKIAAGEALTKDQINGGMSNMVSKLGLGREAASVVKMGQQTFPGNDMSYQGAKYLSSIIKAGVNYQRSQYEYKADLVKQAQSLPIGSAQQRQALAQLSTADSDFARVNPPEKTFAWTVIPLIPAQAKARLLANADHPDYVEGFNKTFGGAGKIDVASYIISDAAKATQKSTLRNGQ